MGEETILNLAIVRNRLLSGRFDIRDQEILDEVSQRAANTHTVYPHSAYLAIVQWAIANAVQDIKSRDFGRAARELDLVHNIPVVGNWSAWDEEYFLKGTVATYMEHASVDRIRGLFANFAKA